MSTHFQRRPKPAPGIEMPYNPHAIREAFTLAPLPFAYDALEPVIDRDSLRWHYEVHHRECVDKLNESLKDVATDGFTLDKMMSRISKFPKAVRGHGGGHWNHTFFWNILTDQKEDREISPELLHAFEKSYGTLEDFRSYFAQASHEVVGSGWIWLIKTASGRLKITTTQNNDNPLMDVCETNGTPILNCDIWEHSYHSHFKGSRDDYIRQFFAIVNWSRVHSLFVGDLH